MKIAWMQIGEFTMKEWSYWNDLREEASWRSFKLIMKEND